MYRQWRGEKYRSFAIWQPLTKSLQASVVHVRPSLVDIISMIQQTEICMCIIEGTLQILQVSVTYD